MGDVSCCALLLAYARAIVIVRRPNNGWRQRLYILFLILKYKDFVAVLKLSKLLMYKCHYEHILLSQLLLFRN